MSILAHLVSYFGLWALGNQRGIADDKAKTHANLPSLKLPWGTYQAEVLLGDTNPQRFSAPSFPSWTNASAQPVKDGRNCIQIDPTALNRPPGGESPVDDPADQIGRQDEDCLFLDLYVPKSAFEEQTKPMPVIVWLYGGAFAFGSKNQFGPLYTGQSIVSASRYQTIFVAGNYRLGAFGWLAGNYLQRNGQPNAGLYDQALLFEWIQKYVGSVGGDSTSVTAWGESAGAGSILHHLVREDGSKDPTFKTFAVQSPAFEWAWDNAPDGMLDRVYQNFSQLAGCGLSYNIDCLRTSKNLTAANQKLFETVKQTGLFPVGPAVDGKWVTRIPTLSFASGKYWKTNINAAIVSHCQNEPESFIPSYFTSEKTFVDFLTVFLPGAKPAAQRDKIFQRYNCESRFQGNYRDCVATVIRDASFTCNTRDLFTAFPNQTHAMSYGFPFSRYARHASDLVPLFVNNQSEAVELLKKVASLSDCLAEEYANSLVNTNVSKAYQTYFASFALSSGDPNTLPQPQLPNSPAPKWTVANGSLDSLTNVLNVQIPFTQPAFVVDRPDYQNTKSACVFWTNLAQEIVANAETLSTEPNIRQVSNWGNEWSAIYHVPVYLTIPTCVGFEARDCSIPGTVIVTQTPAGTITQTTTGDVAGTSTIPGGGTTSGTVIVTSIPLPTYSCDDSGYMIQDQTLFRINLTTGFQTVVNAPVGTGPVNAVGYNVLDNYIYGIANNSGVNQIIRIGSNGDYAILPIMLPAGTWNVGDIDAQGGFFVSQSGKAWIEIDLNPSSADFGAIVTAGDSTASLPANNKAGVSDWVYVPSAGPYLYSIASTQVINGILNIPFDSHFVVLERQAPCLAP
ncbi:hypothetical protein PFICI_10482 [Pestalotiopsis fici W106-1]|uniref:Uncharacterized protein n=1 Tax=Pestalotiopsis fici (strain W106-1 / CGMCC3.15140) TaxID=1229662 RepID=W3WX42_PESFW|nr:uncharacterized protein PFICI_10482 [Pestalotiopsis fici W106-1]ETS78420.1 hypothetical protein PFICI_10482 [Pestalotiopsis fici W106-1]